MACAWATSVIGLLRSLAQILHELLQLVRRDLLLEDVRHQSRE